MEESILETGVELDRVTDLEALNAFTKVVVGNLDPEYDGDVDGPAKVQGALEFYRELFGEGPEAHTAQLVDMVHDAQDAASIITILEESEDADCAGECECEAEEEEISYEEEPSEEASE